MPHSPPAPGIVDSPGSVGRWRESRIGSHHDGTVATTATYRLPLCRIVRADGAQIKGIGVGLAGAFGEVIQSRPGGVVMVQEQAEGVVIC